MPRETINFQIKQDWNFTVYSEIKKTKLFNIFVTNKFQFQLQNLLNDREESSYNLHKNENLIKLTISTKDYWTKDY